VFVADIVDVGIDCVEEPKIVGAAPLPVELEPKISVDDLALPLPEVAAVSDSVPDAAVLETDGAAPAPVVELNTAVDNMTLPETAMLKDSVPEVVKLEIVGAAVGPVLELNAELDDTAPLELLPLKDSVPDVARLEIVGAAAVPVLKLNIPVDDIALLELVSLSVPVVGDTKTVGIALLIV
jgi:hypothetical protein